jgi:hypothetical protein
MERAFEVSRGNGGTAVKRIMTTTVAGALLCAGYAAAQALAFDVRLTPAPVDARTQASVTGEGRASVTLSGRRLVIEGTFTGLKLPASMARLHLASAIGVRGPAIHDLEVTKATKGMVAASIELSAPHAEALEAGLLYIQIDGEETPEGNLWGWLIP